MGKRCRKLLLAILIYTKPPFLPQSFTIKTTTNSINIGRPATLKHLLDSHFREYDSPEFKLKRAKCHHCDTELVNENPRKVRHLAQCDTYLDIMAELGKDNAITLKAKRLSSKQPALQMAKLDKGVKERFDKQATLAVIMGARLFSLFEEPYMKSFIQSVSGNTYTPPSSRKIGRK